MKRTWIIATLLLALPLSAQGAVKKPDLPKNEEYWFALMLDGNKSGHCVVRRDSDATTVKSVEELRMIMRRGPIALTISTKSTSVETHDGKPISFTHLTSAMMMNTEIKGTVDKNGKMKITTISGGAETTKTMDWPKGAMMAWGLELLSRKMGTKEGTKYEAKVFEASTTTAMDAEITVGGKTTTDLFGRIVEGIKVTTIISMGGTPMTSVGYVDPKTFQPFKSTVPMMGMKFELLACEKQVALSKNNPSDIMKATLVQSPIGLNNPRKIAKLQFSVEPSVENAKLSFPDTDNQKVTKGTGGSFTLNTNNVRPPRGASFPYKGSDKRAAEALKPNEYIQSDQPEISELAKKAVGGKKDAADAVAAIEKFVGEYINQKNLQVGYASALEVAKSRQGDCTEHAVLTAALCRSQGIPAEVVFGIAYVDEYLGKKNVFVPHAWNRVFIEGKWYGIDAALRGHDAARITMACGDGTSNMFFEVVATLNNFKITKISGQ